MAFDPRSNDFKVGLILAPMQLGRPGKTGLWEEAAMVDRYPALQAALRYLVHTTQHTARLWPFPPGALQKTFQDHALALGMFALQPCLYSLRHGGASEDSVLGRRDIATVKARGRWPLGTLHTKGYGRWLYYIIRLL